MWVNILLSFAMFLFIVFISSVLAMLSKNELKSGLLAQSGFILSTILIIFLFLDRDFSVIGLNFESNSIILGIVVSFPISLVLAYMISRLNVECEPPIKVEGAFEYIAFLILLAPIAEEFVFRGLLEGYLLKTTTPIVGVMFPATLFSIMHIAPFKEAPRKFLSLILLSAFTLGVIAGILRFMSDSLIPAIVTHAIFNLSGKIAEKI
ncbi:MAG: CPBP family intramembrane glutamic endopeptidase [Candidatus Njordarchaeia archaeon]